jgi:hypothetical protein
VNLKNHAKFLVTMQLIYSASERAWMEKAADQTTHFQRPVKAKAAERCSGFTRYRTKQADHDVANYK